LRIPTRVTRYTQSFERTCVYASLGRLQQKRRERRWYTHSEREREGGGRGVATESGRRVSRAFFAGTKARGPLSSRIIKLRNYLFELIHARTCAYVQHGVSCTRDFFIRASHICECTACTVIACPQSNHIIADVCKLISCFRLEAPDDSIESKVSNQVSNLRLADK